ncbi:MAG: MFS transporter [Planctomycetota bacterium]
MGHRVMRTTASLVFALQFGAATINPQLDLYVRELLDPATVQGSWLGRLAGLGWSDDSGMTLAERTMVLANSLLFGVSAVANLLTLSAWGMYGDKVGHRRALVHCSFVCIAALALQAAVPHYVGLLAGRVLIGVGMAGAAPLAFGLAAGLASVDRRGGAFGVVFSARTLAVAVGGTIGGFLYPWIGARGVLAASTVAVTAALIAFWRGRRSAAAATTR